MVISDYLYLALCDSVANGMYAWVNRASAQTLAFRSVGSSAQPACGSPQIASKKLFDLHRCALQIAFKKLFDKREEGLLTSHLSNLGDSLTCLLQDCLKIPRLPQYSWLIGNGNQAFSGTNRSRIQTRSKVHKRELNIHLKSIQFYALPDPGHLANKKCLASLHRITLTSWYSMESEWKVYSAAGLSIQKTSHLTFCSGNFPCIATCMSKQSLLLFNMIAPSTVDNCLHLCVVCAVYCG